MATSKPQSFISWNSFDFLKYKLDKLIDNGDITFYMFIHHYPEPKDENGFKERKDHFHVYFEPADKIDVRGLYKYFSEIEEKGINRPHEIRNSKFVTAYLYFLHDKKYLDSLPETRKYHYKISDLIVSNNDIFIEKVKTIDYSVLKNYDQRVSKIKESIKLGYDFPSMVSNGLIPIEKISQYEKAYRYIVSVLNNKNRDVDEIIRNGGGRHD